MLETSTTSVFAGLKLISHFRAHYFIFRSLFSTISISANSDDELLREVSSAYKRVFPNNLSQIIYEPRHEISNNLKF